MATTRTKKPRAPLAVAPLYISQETAPALLGITGRKFLEQVVPRCQGQVTRLGQTAMVPADVVVACLARLAANDGDDDQPDAQSVADDDEPQGVDAVLRRLGKERV